MKGNLAFEKSTFFIKATQFNIMLMMVKTMNMKITILITEIIIGIIFIVVIAAVAVLIIMNTQ